MKVYLFNLICSYVAFFNIIYAQSPSQSSQVSKAVEYIKHADTYYWLSRARDNEITDINKAIFYFEKAQNELKGIEKSPDVMGLNQKIQKGLNTLRVQKEDATSELKNFTPLFTILLNQDEIVEYFDDPHDVALENSIASLPFAKLLIKYVVPLSYDLSVRYAVEEIAHHYLNSNTNIYVITQHELADILSSAEIDLLYQETPDPTVLNKVATGFSQVGIGLLRLEMIDQVDNLSYASSHYQFWNMKKQVFEKEISTYAFSETPHPGSLWMLLLLFLGIPIVLIYNALNRQSEGSYPPAWFGLAVALSSFIITAILFRTLSLLEIDGGTLIWTPSGLGWISVLVLSMSLLPLFLIYMGSARIKTIGVVLNNPETIAAMVFGTFLGSFTLLAMTATVRLGFENALIMMVPSILSIGVFAFVIGRSYSGSVMNCDQASKIENMFLLLALFIYTACILNWDVQTVVFASFGLLIFSGPVVSVPLMLIHALEKKLSGDSGIKIEKGIRFSHKNAIWEVVKPGNQNSMAMLVDSNEVQKEIDNEIILKNIIKEEEQSGIGWLRREIKEPKFFNTIGQVNFDKIIKFVEDGLDDDKSPKIEVVFIEADMGMGKTRLAKELAEGIKNRFEKDKKFKTTILFGDCDDPQYDADLVPYEPFAQALSKLLNVNRFSNPAKKAEELRSSPTGQVLGSILKGGLGPLGVLLDAEDEGQPQKANTKEIANTIAKVLTQLSEDNGKIIFIIDDTQWMDDDSFELLGVIINILSGEKPFKGKNKVSFIFTSRSKDDDKINDFLIEKEKEEVFNVNRDVNHEIFQKEPKIVDGFLDNLKFDFRSKQVLVNYFNDLGIRSPLQILQTLDTAVEKKMIECYADKFILAKGADLKKLPKPDDYNRMVEELLNGLDPRLLDKLQCAAVLGRSFKASIISEIFKVDMLDFLDMVKGAEERNILKDISEKDDIYEFVQKRMVGIFRNLRAQGDDEFIPQMVREYHKRYVEIKEKEFEQNNIPQNEIPYRDLLSLATHSRAIADVYPEKALVYNNLAAGRASDRNLFNAANKLFNHCINILSTFETTIDVSIQLNLFIDFAKCLLNAGNDLKEVGDCIEKAHKIIDNADDAIDITSSKIELRLIEALKFYRDKDLSNARRIAKEIIDHDATEVQKLRAKFYYAISVEDNPKARKEEHLKVIELAENLSKKDNLTSIEQNHILQVMSEVYNNTGFTFLHGEKKPELAKDYFHRAIEVKKKPEINDLLGIAMAHGGLGGCCEKLEDLCGAEEHYRENLKISRDIGSKTGITNTSSKLGAIKLKYASVEKDDNKKNELIIEANKYYIESLEMAKDQNNISSIMFALKGLFECAIIADDFDDCKQFFQILNEYLESYKKLLDKYPISKIKELKNKQKKEKELKDDENELKDDENEFLNDYNNLSGALLILSHLPPKFVEEPLDLEAIQEKNDGQFKKEIENYYKVINDITEGKNHK